MPKLAESTQNPKMADQNIVDWDAIAALDRAGTLERSSPAVCPPVPIAAGAR